MNAKLFSAAAGVCALFGTLAFAQATATVSNADRQFMSAAAEINMAEAHLGKMAQERASRQEVKDFGQRLERDHTNANQQLSGMAGQLQVKIPTALDTRRQAEANRLNSLTGANFDSQFLAKQIQAHQDAINRFQRASTQSGNQQVKDWATQMLPTLQEHLQIAQNLASGGGSASRMSEEGAQAGAAGAKSSVHYGTVTKYEAGKTLEVKMRGRTGRHSYDLNNVTANITGDISSGSRVKISESVDENGRRTISVEPAPAPGAAGRQQKGEKKQPPPQQ